jgi:hypothetical protein
MATNEWKRSLQASILMSVPLFQTIHLCPSEYVADSKQSVHCHSNLVAHLHIKFFNAT